MSRGPDASTLLRRALERHAERCDINVEWRSNMIERWASATFVGARHRLALVVTGSGVPAWVAALDEADLPLRGHLVADLIVTTLSQCGEQAALGIEVLTVET